MTRAQSLTIHVLVALIIVPLAWVMAYRYYPSSPPIVWAGTNDIIPNYAKAGTTVSIRRTFRVNDDVDVEITRQLVRRERGITTTVELKDAKVFYQRGVYRQERPLVVPCEASPGKWALESTHYYLDTLGRRKVTFPPVLTLVVYEPCG